MVDWLTLAVPFVYLTILIGSLATFSSLYRSRKISRAASLAPWFGPHVQRDIYLSLLHLEPEQGKIPESVLRAALLRRAAEDIHRIVSIRNAKQALSTLLQRGSVGDDLWQRFQRAEKEIEEELRDVVSEANAYVPGWGQLIFQSASEMINNGMVRSKVDEVQGTLTTEKAWWDNRRANIEQALMKQVDDEAAAAAAKKGEPVQSPTSTSSLASPKSDTAPRSSDDEVVMVEAGGPAAAAPQGSSKKKGKKNKH